MKPAIISIIVIFFYSCLQKSPRIITIKHNTDLIPEGIAVHDQKIFLSSIFKNKIIQYNINSQKASDFISTNEYNFGSGIGLFVKDNLLFALTNSSIKRSEKSIPSLFVFDIHDKKLIKTYSLNDSLNHLWNDLTFSSNNEIYITDTRLGKIYMIQYPEEKIVQYYSDSTIISPNGIDLSQDGKRLFIASDKYGIRILDRESKKITNSIDTATAGIDGLKYYNSSLYAVKNSALDHSKHRLLKINLSKDNNLIESVEGLELRNDLWNVPTTIDIKDGYLYLLANSQMDNLDQEALRIIDTKVLTNTYVVKMKLSDYFLSF
jgi:WD40 repeat protein